MYQEYAIDPTTICRSFDRFRLVWNGLGYAEGRLLSRFPGSWEKKVVKSQSYKDLPDGSRKKAIEESLVREAKEKQKLKSIASGRAYNSNTQSWLEEAECVHCERPFHGILSEANPRNQSGVFCYDEDLSWADRWTVPRPWQVLRDSRNLTVAAAPLLRVGREVLFVEPYFQFQPRFTEPLKGFFTTLLPYAGVINRLEIHLKNWDAESNDDTFADDFQRSMHSRLMRCCPPNAKEILEKLDFYIWDSPAGNSMHPRYILTEVAGLGFENGLDENLNGNTYTDVSIVAGESLKRRWNEFQQGTATRSLIRRIRAQDVLR